MFCTSGTQFCPSPSTLKNINFLNFSISGSSAAAPETGNVLSNEKVSTSSIEKGIIF